MDRAEDTSEAERNIIYGSAQQAFLLRAWPSTQPNGIEWRFSLEHVITHKRETFVNVEQLGEFLNHCFKK